MQPDVPTLRLNVAEISGFGLGSVPVSALARVPGYQTPGIGAPGKFRATLTGAADPRVPLVAVQAIVLDQLARTVIVGPLFSVAPQMFAAHWKAFSRCWPRVVPVLPPIGDAGVASLNPTPAASPLSIMIVACPDADDAATRLTASMTRKIENFLRTFLITY